MVKILKLSTVLLAIFINCNIIAQTSQEFGTRDNMPSVFALENARIISSSGNIIDEGTLVVRDGLIEAVGENVDIPGDAWVYNLDGKTVYPGFIELYSDVGLPDIEKEGMDKLQALDIPDEYIPMLSRFLSSTETEIDRAGAYHWNPHVRTWYNAAGQYKYDEEKAQSLRSQGFTTAHVIPQYGVFQGQTALVSLGKGTSNELVKKSNITQALSFQISPELESRYPTSLMGVIALMRQTFHDTEWYLEAHNAYYEDPLGLTRPEKNLALASLIEASRGIQPVVFSVDDEIALLRAKNIVEEFDLNSWFKVSGKEYRRLDATINDDSPVIVPLDFPEKPDVDSFDEAIELSLENLMHWELAPENPARIYDAGANMSITSDGTTNNGEFLNQLRIAVERGLPEYAAIDALTINPARVLEIEETHGTLDEGKIANFIIANGNIFDSDTKIEEVWVDGEKYPVDKPYELTAQGKWKLELNDTADYQLKLKGTVGDYEGKLIFDEEEVELKNVKFDKQRLSFLAEDVFDVNEGVIRMSAQVSEETMFGTGEWPSGEFFNWKAEKVDDIDLEDKPNDNEEDEEEEFTVKSSVLYPPMEYGIKETPEQVGCILVKDATVWTQSDQGIIENGDLLVRNGRIEEVDENIDTPRNCKTIDASGKHVTPGLIDPHLHTSISRGVNEVGSAITSETRIKDVVNPNNIWVYRLLAGGLTTANLLHGSANPIGGQDAVVKMRWGGLPEEMIFEEAKPGLKLALGENVKRLDDRYPSSRMGTEQIIKDAFQAALDYKTERDKKHSEDKPFRKDVQLEVLLEVLEGERVVHAHAYRHDEMKMLVRLAEEFGFKIKSFEHTVEGYKIADVLKEHGAGAVVWTDWSSFKMEAYDANIYNARLLLEHGTLTSLHSDNTQLSTRMYREAGKIAGTGVQDEDAMDLITINPAKILGIDHVVGSLEEDKHGDFVIWSDHPLNGYAHAEQTWIEGRKYFDIQQDRETLKEVLKLKNILTNKVLESN